MREQLRGLVGGTDARWPVCPVCGVLIHSLTMNQVLGVVNETIVRHGRLLIGVVNAAKMVNLRKDPELRGAVLSSDLVLADGMSVVWASRLLGRPLPERVAGIDLMIRMLELADQQGYRVFLLGATQEVLGGVREHIASTYPGVEVVGARNGYYTPAEEESIAREIAATRPQMLFVAMTSPKKERFLARWSELMDVQVCHGVGGSFDVLAGLTRRAPRRWQALGLEWLYRVLQEPRRLWKRYLVTNTLFMGLVLRDLVKRPGSLRGG